MGGGVGRPVAWIFPVGGAYPPVGGANIPPVGGANIPVPVGGANIGSLPWGIFCPEVLGGLPSTGIVRLLL